MPDHPEPTGDVVEDLRDVFTEPSHVATTGGTGASPVVLRFVRDLLTGQVVRQRLTLWPAPLTYWKRPAFGGSLGDLFGLAGFQFLEPQLELFDLPGQPLRGAAELSNHRSRVEGLVLPNASSGFLRVGDVGGFELGSGSSLTA